MEQPPSRRMPLRDSGRGELDDHAVAGAIEQPPTAEGPAHPSQSGAAPQDPGYVVNGVHMTAAQYEEWQQADRPSDTEDYSSHAVTSRGTLPTAQQVRRARKRADKLQRRIREVQDARSQRTLHDFFDQPGTQMTTGADAIDQQLIDLFNDDSIFNDDGLDIYDTMGQPTNWPTLGGMASSSNMEQVMHGPRVATPRGQRCSLPTPTPDDNANDQPTAEVAPQPKEVVPDLSEEAAYANKTTRSKKARDHQKSRHLATTLLSTNGGGGAAAVRLHSLIGNTTTLWCIQ